MEVNGQLNVPTALPPRKSSQKNYSPTFLWYDMDRIDKDASNNFSLTRERICWAVA
jgi:hypothetical protein